jgi:anti-sigma factor RsiW
MANTLPGEQHLESWEVSGYLSGCLPAEGRARVERHLVECEACDTEMVAVARLARPVRSRVRWLALGTAAAAAVAGVLLVGPVLVRRSGPTQVPERGVEAPLSVRVVLPAERAELRGAPEFVWRNVSGATAYRISVTRADGDSVWALTTRDTTAAVPAGATPAGTGPYYWVVDALLGDGRSVAGTMREFRIQP